MFYKHILIATDLSDITDKLLKKGTRFGGLFEAKISLLHIVNHIPVYGYANGAVIEIENELVDKAKDDLSKVAAKYKIPTENTWIKAGSATNRILEFAEENAVDLIIVGSHV
jgi:universal stress protein A